MTQIKKWPKFKYDPNQKWPKFKNDLNSKMTYIIKKKLKWPKLKKISKFKYDRNSKMTRIKKLPKFKNYPNSKITQIKKLPKLKNYWNSKMTQRLYTKLCQFEFHKTSLPCSCNHCQCQLKNDLQPNYHTTHWKGTKWSCTFNWTKLKSIDSHHHFHFQIETITFNHPFRKLEQWL